MALGPKQMGEAILQNLESKTGKDISAWTTIVAKSGLEAKKEIIGFLKVEHQLGHFQAQKVYEVFSDKDPYSGASNFEKDLFTSENARNIYETLKTALGKLGKDVVVRPCKTYIPFYRNNRFAITKGKGEAVIVAINLTTPAPGFTAATSFKGSERMNFETVLRSTSDVNDALMATIKKSYLLN